MEKRPAPPSTPTRVDALVTAIPADAATMADVGYDLGRIALAALARRPDLRILGVEVQPEAAERMAERMLADGIAADVRARFVCRTGDGLQPVGEGEVDGALMAGMGERTMARILGDSPATARSLKWLVLCTSHLESTLRRDLDTLGWSHHTASIVFENNRFYEVIVARPATEGVSTRPDPITAHWGAELTTTIAPALARAFVADVATRFRAAIASGFRAYRDDPDKQALAAKLALIPAVMERLAGR